MGEIFSGLSININDLLHLHRYRSRRRHRRMKKGENYWDGDEILFLSSIDNHKRTQNLFKFECIQTDITIQNELITKPFLNTFQFH